MIVSMILLNVRVASADGPGWSEDVKLSYSRAAIPSMTVNGSDIHVVWTNDSVSEISYRRSEDYGLTWTPERLITNISAGGVCDGPNVAVTGNTVHVVFESERESPDFEVWYMRSDDNGNTWTEEIQLSDDDIAGSLIASVAAAGDDVYVLWADERHNFIREIYFKRSTDGGNTWTADRRLTFHQDGTTSKPALIITPDKLHLVYNEHTGGSPSTMEPMYMYSTDKGDNWSEPLMLSQDQSMHSIFYGPGGFDVDGDTIHVVWDDNRFWDGGEIYYRRSTDAGLSWEPEVRITYDLDNSQMQPYVSAKDDFVQIFWQDARDKPGNIRNIYSVNSTDGGASWNEDYRVTHQPWPVSSWIRRSGYDDDGYTHIIYIDNRTGTRHLYYKRSPDFGEPIPEFGNIVVPVVATLLMVTVATRVRKKKRG